jgi:ABC-2 type transport system ATP-binding protein
VSADAAVQASPLSFTRASRWYGPVIALNDVTVSIPPGVTGLLGPNGAGKSTFLKLAAGQLRPSQGEVRLLGKAAWGSPEVFHRVGLCPETDAFWEHLTGLQFLTTLLRFTGYDGPNAVTGRRTRSTRWRSSTRRTGRSAATARACASGEIAQAIAQPECCSSTSR